MNKTGLGSSAALTTSLVAALLVHFQVIQQVVTDAQKELVHRIAQFCHCLSQGKIGSGFDVCAAVYGSCKYHRFNTSVLKSVLDMAMQSNGTCSNELYVELSKTCQIPMLLAEQVDHSVWDHSYKLFKLPPGFQLFVADVDQGSNTPSLVSNVLKWKAQNGDSGKKFLRFTHSNSILELDRCFEPASRSSI